MAVFVESFVKKELYKSKGCEASAYIFDFYLIIERLPFVGNCNLEEETLENRGLRLKRCYREISINLGLFSRAPA